MEPILGHGAIQTHHTDTQNYVMFLNVRTDMVPLITFVLIDMKLSRPICVKPKREIKDVKKNSVNYSATENMIFF